MSHEFLLIVRGLNNNYLVTNKKQMETLQKAKASSKQEKTSQSSANGAEKVNISGSEAVMRVLVAEKVDTIFGYPGGAIMPIYDALYDWVDTLKHILVR